MAQLGGAAVMIRGGSRRVWSHSVRRWLVQMRCRECAAEVGVTARVCSRCGAPIVGQPPVVVADTVVADMAVVDMAVVDMAVAAISDAAGKAVPAGVAGQALPEPYVPGSGDRVSAELSCAILVDWAAWAASTTFSSTGLRFGYHKREVDAIRSAVRDTFLGGAVFWVSTPPVKSDDLRGKQFSTHLPGYDKKQVAAFLDAASIRLAAMESTDRPAGPLVSDALLVAWAEWADSTTFSKPIWRHGYSSIKVDAFREKIRDTFLGARRSPLKSDKVRGKQFSSTDDGPRYDKKQVAAFLDAAGIRLAAMESTDRPERPLVSGAILAEWAEWADSTRFSTAPRLWEGYATAEVDAFRKELRDTFLGVRQPSRPGSRNRPGPKRATCPWFSTTRGWSRPGYAVQEVDAFLNMAKLRLAAITPDNEFTLYRAHARTRTGTHEARL